MSAGRPAKGAPPTQSKFTLASSRHCTGDRTISIIVSIGCAVGVGTPEDLVEQADTALYRSKSEGRDRVRAAGMPAVTSRNG